MNQPPAPGQPWLEGQGRGQGGRGPALWGGGVTPDPDRVGVSWAEDPEMWNIEWAVSSVLTCHLMWINMRATHGTEERTTRCRKVAIWWLLLEMSELSSAWPQYTEWLGAVNKSTWSWWRWWILAFNIPYQSRCGSRSPDQETDANQFCFVDNVVIVEGGHYGQVLVQPWPLNRSIRVVSPNILRS